MMDERLSPDDAPSCRAEGPLKLIQDPQYRRLKCTVDWNVAFSLFNTPRFDFVLVTLRELSQSRCLSLLGVMPMMKILDVALVWTNFDQPWNSSTAQNITKFKIILWLPWRTFYLPPAMRGSNGTDRTLRKFMESSHWSLRNSFPFFNQMQIQMMLILSSILQGIFISLAYARWKRKKLSCSPHRPLSSLLIMDG